MAKDIDEVKYRNYILKLMPARDPDGRGWIAQFMVLKHEGMETKAKVVKDPGLHVHEDKGEAIKHSISLGKFWIDREEGAP